jgi:Zn-dependent protease
MAGLAANGNVTAGVPAADGEREPDDEGHTHRSGGNRAQRNVSQELLVLLPLWYVVFLLAITCHEAAHAFAAYRGGDLTAYRGGQVTLNPIPHMQREPFGTVIVPLISYFLFGADGGSRWMFGWASAPYDPLWEDRHPKRAAAMAAAGPAANLVLALIGLIVLKVGLAQGLWMPAGRPGLDRLVAAAGESAGLWDGLGRFASVLFSLNLILCMLNMIPLPPLDGASVVSGLFRPVRQLRERIGSSPMLGLVGLLVAWQIFPFFFRPVYWGLVRWLYA